MTWSQALEVRKHSARLCNPVLAAQDELWIYGSLDKYSYKSRRKVVEIFANWRGLGVLGLNWFESTKAGGSPDKQRWNATALELADRGGGELLRSRSPAPGHGGRSNVE